MYGVPADLDLTFLKDAELTQICLGQYQVQLHFHPIGSISVEGRWELFNSTGLLIDQSHEGNRQGDESNRRLPYQLHLLLGQRVTGFEVSAPDWFAISFAGGESLRVHDDSRDYESFSIQPGDIFI